MSEFLLPLLVSVLVPVCALTLLLWLAHLEDTLDQSVQRRSAKATAEGARSEQGPAPAQARPPAPAPVSAPAAQRPAR